jgi:hypothetical protein
MMNGEGKSDRPIVLMKPPNKAEGGAAEVAEGRSRTKGNLQESNALRTRVAGSVRKARSSGYVKQQERIGNSGSPRFCTMSTTSNDCARHSSP